MQLIPKKYFIVVLASILVIAFGLMSLYLNNKKAQRFPADSYDNDIRMIETQSDSDNIQDIEKDLFDTDIESLDKELQDMETEIESVEAF